MAAFFARRPLRLVWRAENAGERATASGPLAALGVVAAVAFGGAVWWGGLDWLGWLVPAAAAGAVFLYFDLQAAGREGVAEVAGAAAFACVPAAMAAAAGWEFAAAGALAVAMLGRAVPAVLTVRASLRAAKTSGAKPRGAGDDGSRARRRSRARARRTRADGDGGAAGVFGAPDGGAARVAAAGVAGAHARDDRDGAGDRVCAGRDWRGDEVTRLRKTETRFA